MLNTTLLEKANQVLEEKNTKILPENLKSGITAFGVMGQLTSGPINEQDYQLAIEKAKEILGTAKASSTDFDTFISDLTRLQTAMDNALIAAKSDEAIRGNNRSNAQLYNFIARGGYEVLPKAANGDEKWLIQSDATVIPCNLIKKEYTETSQLGTSLPITTVATSYGDNELPSYFVTPKGKVFCYPGFAQDGKTYVAPATIVTDENGNEVDMTQLIPIITKITLDNGEVIYINNEQVEKIAPELLRSFSTQFPNLATDPSIWYNGMVVSDNGAALGYTFEGYLNNTKQY